MYDNQLGMMKTAPDIVICQCQQHDNQHLITIFAVDDKRNSRIYTQEVEAIDGFRNLLRFYPFKVTDREHLPVFAGNNRLAERTDKGFHDLLIAMQGSH